jgi:hypothetical protein
MLFLCTTEAMSRPCRHFGVGILTYQFDKTVFLHLSHHGSLRQTCVSLRLRVDTEKPHKQGACSSPVAMSFLKPRVSLLKVAISKPSEFQENMYVELESMCTSRPFKKATDTCWFNPLFTIFEKSR